jgi:hypothetical protein
MPPGEPLLTVAERSEWQATATHAEVMTLVDSIAERSPIARRATLGHSVEGREIPLLILADPPVASAEAARRTGKLVVFAFGNIHAGEVCGKEALLMLARELALEPHHPLLEHLVVVLCPIYNADGNERMSPENRPGQRGPAQGMGRRPNAQGLDLNRDYVKLESPEARAHVRFLTEWNPHVTVDTHTTNGSEHGYVLTYAAPLNPSGYGPSIRFVRDRMLPEISRRLETRTGYRTFFYGNFDKAMTTWSTYSPRPRFGGPYRGLRGQMSILSEAYSYADYRDRVLATLEFVREILRYAAEEREAIRGLHEQAREATTRAGEHPQPDDVVGIRHRIAAMDEPAVILGAASAGTEPPLHTVVHRGRFEATRGVRRPHAYIVAPGTDEVLANLDAHGITVEPVTGEALVEVYTVASQVRAERPFQGHRTIRLEVDARLERRRIEPGSTLVRTGQPLGNLIVYLLEPESDDGLAAWNFFDEVLEDGEEFPVYRLRAAHDLERSR